ASREVSVTPVLGPATFTCTARDAFGGEASDGVVVTGTDATPPEVHVTAPRGVAIVAGVPYDVLWTARDNGTLARFDVLVSTDGGATFAPVPGCTDLAGDRLRCTWASPGPATASARLRVTATDGAGNTAADTSEFSIVQPVVTVTVPDTPVVWAAGSVQTIRWTHNLGASATFRVELTRDGGQSWTVLAAAAPASDAGSGAFAWTGTGPSTPSARLRVTWTGRDDVSDAGDALFTINRPPVADAGPDQTVELGQPITLDGRGSSDPDGDPLQFEWKDGTGTVVGTTPVVTLDRAIGVH